MFRLATWNVNSVRIRTELLKRLIEEEKPDIICLQEVKAKETDFPLTTSGLWDTDILPSTACRGITVLLFCQKHLCII